MPSSYPGAIDALTNPVAGNFTPNPSHIAQHANANDAIEQLETKLGTGASVPTTTGHVLTVTGAGATAYAAPASAPASADYLVGTAQAGLSAEIVVGTTPGGELGGTWASPTVDASHSGSTHAATQSAAEATAASALTTHAALAHHASMRGTSMPAQPAYGNNIPFWRTDLGMEFYYDGTRWVSAVLYNDAMGEVGTFAMPYAATAAGAQRITSGWAGTYALWLVEARLSFHVVGGTALGASHKWVTVIQNDAGSTLATFNIDSGASDAWRIGTTAAMGSVLASTVASLMTTHTKTGTPGTLYALPRILYRVVAT